MIAELPCIASQPPGVSVEARRLTERQISSRNDRHRTVSFSKDSAFDQLYDLWNDCRTAGWDGGDATAVAWDTYHQAFRIVEALPHGMTLPTIGVEADGHITLEWHRDPRWTLSVSVAPDGMLYYAALFGSDHPRGSCWFTGDLPRTLLDFIRRVYGND